MSASSPAVVAGDIARMLASRIEPLARDLLPAGHREGSEWRCGSLAGDTGRSLGVHLAGPKAGIWCDFATGTAGDALDLVRDALRLRVGEALAWSRRWLGLDDGAAKLPRRPQTARAAPSPRADPDAAARQARALDIWRDAIEDIAGTPAEIYMRSRSLDPMQLASLHGPGRWPATLRYSARAALDPDRECRAMVIAVHGADCGLVRAVQRILLDADGSAVRDARGRRAKLSLGPIAGNAAMGDYEPDPQGRWALAEGIESALAAYTLTGIPTWAAISAANMPRVAPPSWARHVSIFADRAAPGMAAAGEACRRLRERPGIETVRVVAAAEVGADAADVMHGGGHA